MVSVDVVVAIQLSEVEGVYYAVLVLARRCVSCLSQSTIGASAM